MSYRKFAVESHSPELQSRGRQALPPTWKQQASRPTPFFPRRVCVLKKTTGDPHRAGRGVVHQSPAMLTAHQRRYHPFLCGLYLEPGRETSRQPPGLAGEITQGTWSTHLCPRRPEALALPRIRGKTGVHTETQGSSPVTSPKISCSLIPPVSALHLYSSLYWEMGQQEYQ